MAGKGFKRDEKWKWTPEVEERLASLYGTMKPQHIATRLTNEFGFHFSMEAVRRYATQELGIKVTDAQGELTISDAARELGVKIHTLHQFISKQGLTVTGTGYCRFLTPETWRALQAYYVKPPEPTLSIPEAAERLNFTVDGIYKQVKTQRLRAWRWGGKWRVSVADVERARIEQARQRQLDRGGPSNP